MTSIFRSISALLLSVTLLLLGNSLLGTLVAVRTNMLDYPLWTIGAIMSCYFVGQMLGTQFLDRIIGNVGHIRAFAAFASIMSALPILQGYLVYPVSWGILRLVNGACIAGLLMVTESWINTRCTNKDRGSVLATYMIISYGAIGSGQLLLNLADPALFVLFALVSVLLSFAVVPVALTRVTAPSLPPLVKLSFPKLFALSPLAVVGSMGAGLVNSAFYGMGPVYARSSGLAISDVALFMSVPILASLIMQFPIGRLSDSIDRRWVIIVMSFAVAASSLGVALAETTEVSTLLLLGALFGGTAFTIYSLSVAHANDQVSNELRVQASGGLLFGYAIGASCGPLLSSQAMAFAGPKGLFLYTAAISALIGCFALIRLVARRTIPVIRRSRFVPMPKISPVAKSLDPNAR
jgi:MFS family permease